MSAYGEGCGDLQGDPAAGAGRGRRSQPDVYKVREVNGQEHIEYLPDGSRWMLRAKEAAYGLAVSMAAVDEAWKVRSHTIEEGRDADDGGTCPAAAAAWFRRRIG